MVDAYPDITIVASKVALAYLKGLTNRSFTERAVKGGDKVSVRLFTAHGRDLLQDMESHHPVLHASLSLSSMLCMHDSDA